MKKSSLCCPYLVPCKLVGRDARAVCHVPDVTVVIVVASEQEPTTPREGHGRDAAQDLTKRASRNRPTPQQNQQSKTRPDRQMMSNRFLSNRRK